MNEEQKRWSNRIWWVLKMCFYWLVIAPIAVTIFVILAILTVQAWMIFAHS